MSVHLEASPAVHQAESVASRTATAARVHIVNEFDLDRLRAVAGMLAAVWGTGHHRAPIPLDLLRSISHAGCGVTAAYDDNGTLCGAAVAIVSPDNVSMYSLIAGVLPGTADRGIGFALKQHQRAWALARGFTTMTWTFDPLVSRNARFNLTKLGAHASEYITDFYGPMEDEINSNDESDRLVAVWPLTSARTIACSEGELDRIEIPSFSERDIRAFGPDQDPALVEAHGSLWCRVPADIVGLRALHPDQAQAWRGSVREIFTTAFAAESTAHAVTRTGWYRLATGGQQ